jgi:hypothetical protein
MTQFCKVGFHGGGGGNHRGISDYMDRLDKAKIPFCLKSVNNVGLAVEAAHFARASGVPHVIVLRWSNPGVPPGLEVPDYRLSPEEAAQDHWRLLKQSIDAAPEFDEFKDLVWIESFNEPRTERDPADPNFEDMHHFVGKLAIAEGYRWAAFGMNAGTPEPESWRLPGMVQFLTDCAENPEMLAVALHEYTFNLDEKMKAMYPQLIGRFTWLFEACDDLDIDRPTTLITEGGWVYQDMPGSEQALEDLHYYSKLIAAYPSVRGMHLWTLEGVSQLPDKLQKFIKPVTEYALKTRFPDPEPVSEPSTPEIKTDPETGPVPVVDPAPIDDPVEKETVLRGLPRAQYDRTYVLLPPAAGREWATAVIDATWDGQRLTVGSSADDAGIGDLDSKRVIAVNPREWGDGEDGTGLRGFFERHYPGVKYESLEAPSPTSLRQQLLSRP